MPSATIKDLDRFWPGNPWFKPYQQDLPDLYYPGINIRAASATALGKGNYWFQEPNSFNVESKMSKNIGKHYVKVGGEFRQDKVTAARPRTLNLDYGPELTANTYNAPNTGLSGDGWATFLLGSLSNNSTAQSIPIQRPKVNFGGVFIQDDFKLSLAEVS